MKSLADKNVVITGGAAGIGMLMALNFANEKANVAIVDIDAKKLEETKKEIAQTGAVVHSYKCDVSQQLEIEDTAESIKKKFGQVDILINNAGIAPGEWITEATFSQIERTVDVNLIGLMWMTRQFLPEMTQRNQGHIVNISSAMGLQAVPRMADYVATKFAIIGYSDTLRIEMKRMGCPGVKVTIVCPAGIDTGLFDGYEPPMLTPLLKPEYVAKKIVKAVKKEKKYLKMPAVVHTIPFLRLLPPGITDKLAEMMGLFKSMDHLER